MIRVVYIYASRCKKKPSKEKETRRTFSCSFLSLDDRKTRENVREKRRKKSVITILSFAIT